MYTKLKSILSVAIVMIPELMMANSLTHSLDSLLDANYQPDAPGCALLIASGSKIIYDSGRGVADVKSKQKIDGNTVFNIASVTKQFTAAGILKLQEKGLLSIENPVSMYFPEFKSDIWKRVKIKHLMSHCSGIPDKRPRTDMQFMLFCNDSQSLEYMRELDELEFEPGTNYDYINPTFQLLAEIIHRVSGENFETFQEKNIFHPAKMSNVRYFSPNMKVANVAHGYINANEIQRPTDSDSQKDRDLTHIAYTDSSGDSWVEYDYGEETFFATKADGGIYTSTHDFLHWEKALFNNICLKQSSKEMAYTPHTVVNGSKYCSYQNRPNTAYGYGWFIDTNMPGITKVYHTGDNGGFQAYVAKYPKNNICVIMFENRNDKDRWQTQLEIEKLLIANGIIQK